MTKIRVGFLYRRNPEVIYWDNGKAKTIDNVPDGNGVANAYEGGSRLDLHP
jgi:hypothetical protein